MVLSEIFDAIRRDNVDYIGIKATDIRDTIFLAGMVKLHCPTVQLVVMSTDLLHAHPDFNDSMLGAITVSSYPLFAEGLNWIKSDDNAPRVVLSNQAHYGIYNAVILFRAMHRSEIKPNVEIEADVDIEASAKKNISFFDRFQSLPYLEMRYLAAYGKPFFTANDRKKTLMKHNRQGSGFNRSVSVDSTRFNGNQ